MIAIIALAATASMLAGCAHPAVSVSRSTAPQALKSSPAPSPKPTLNLADPSSWLIGFDQVGPLSIGGRISEEKAQMTAFTDTSSASCPVAMFATDNSPSIWVSPGADGDSINLIALGAALFGKSIPAVEGGTPKTEKGIGIGATEQQLKAAYSGIVETGTYGSETYYGVSNGNGRWIDFVIADGAVDAIAVGSSSTPPSEYCG
jgi:hypothetical protein